MTTEQAVASQVAQVLEQDRPRRRWWLRSLLALITIATIVLWLFPSNNKPTLHFTTQPVTRGDLTIEVTATGTLEPLNQVDVGSEMSGIIDAVLVDFNDRVQQNQILAHLNTDEQQARVVQSQAALNVADARVLQSQATVLETSLKLKRCQTLIQKGLCTPQDLDTAQAAHARANADEASSKALVSQAKATLDVEQTRLAKAEIRSPINGIVLKREIEPGQTVAASLQAPVLFTLAENLTQMELSVAVDEADIGKVHESQQGNFTVDAYGDQIFPATLKQVRLAPLNEGGVVSYETILSVNNEALLLRPGMTATAHITVQQLTNVLQVPNSALRFSPPPVEAKQERGLMDMLLPRWGNRSRQPKDKRNDKLKRVWLIGNDGQPQAIEVTTGPNDGRMTQIIEGELRADAAVITDAVSKKP